MQLFFISYLASVVVRGYMYALAHALVRRQLFQVLAWRLGRV